MNTYTFFAERCANMRSSLTNNGFSNGEANEIICAAIKSGLIK